MSAPPDLSFRTPIPPRPVERFTLTHPAVPRGALREGGLEGLTILHVSDLHTRRAALQTARVQDLLRAVEMTPADLVVLTGDLMDEPGHEPATMEVLAALAERWKPRLGVFSTGGNHDSARLARLMERDLPQIRRLDGRVLDLAIGPCTLRLAGLGWPEDTLGTLVDVPPPDPRSPVLTIALAHHPTCVVAAADAGLPIVLAGHTHAGQVRLHARLAPHTSSDLPPDKATGVLRLRGTLCCISRGVGDGVVEGLRINCPRQVPLYTLAHGQMPDMPRGGSTEVVTQVVAW